MTALAIILRGPSGAGKSTFLNEIIAWAGPDEGTRLPGAPVRVSSADAHFVGRDGVYRFRPSELQRAHAECFRSWVENLRAARFPTGTGPEFLVCDNTNATGTELNPYALAADAYGAEVLVVTLLAPLAVCAARATHGAPEHAIRRQLAACEEPPPFGRAEIVLRDPVPSVLSDVAYGIVREWATSSRAAEFSAWARKVSPR